MENNKCNLCVNCWCHDRLAENSGSHLNFRNPGSLIPLFWRHKQIPFLALAAPPPNLPHLFLFLSSESSGICEFNSYLFHSFHWWIWDFPLRILINCGERTGIRLVTSNPDFFAPQPILLCLRLRASSLTFHPAVSAFCGHGPLLHWLLCHLDFFLVL